ncbi:MAG: PilN domain-containing protein [Noviherbaspirillum sp.]
MSQQINLFNPAFRKQKNYLSAVTMVQGLGLILAGCAALVFYTNYQSGELSKEATASTARLAATQANLVKVKEISGARQKSKKLEDEVQKLEVEIKSLQQVGDVLKKGDFGNTDGYADYFRAFARQIDNGIWLTGLDIRGAGFEIGLKGRALQPELVPAYLSRLKKEPALQGKSFAALEMISASEKPAKEGAAQEKPDVPVGYIEFELKSAGTAGKLPEASGARKR